MSNVPLVFFRPSLYFIVITLAMIIHVNIEGITSMTSGMGITSARNHLQLHLHNCHT